MDLCGSSGLSGSAGVVERAEKLLQSGKAGECAHLLKQEAADGVEVPDLSQWLTICNILRHAQQGEWLKVLDLGPGATARQLRQQYRRLAVQIHPDKCSLPGAEAAFTQLCNAASTCSEAFAGQPGPESAGLESDPFRWWDAWDKSDAGGPAEHVTTSDDASLRDAAELDALDHEALRAEVARRQATLLQPHETSNERDLSLAERQLRLRRARSLLASRSNAANGNLSSQGGFWQPERPQDTQAPN